MKSQPQTVCRMINQLTFRTEKVGEDISNNDYDESILSAILAERQRKGKRQFLAEWDYGKRQITIWLLTTASENYL